MKHHGELPATSRVEPDLRLDCRAYRGDRPCAAGKQGVCASDCDAYNPMYHRILIIKLGALGDVIRTTALLPGLKEAWPRSHITWVTRPAGVRILTNHPMIDRLLPFDAESLLHLEVEHFDLCLSLDKEPAPAALAMRVSATQRRGIGLSRFGTLMPLNAECRTYFQLGLDDHLKFRANVKSYAELIYEAVRKRYTGQRSRLYPSVKNRRRAKEAWRRAGVGNNEVVIGLNTGAGEAIANKTWPEERFARLAEALVDLYGWRVALLGGPLEVERNRRIAEICGGLKTTIEGREVRAVVNVCDAGWPADGPLDELDFAALLTRCRVIVTGDTMALHAASALDVPCVALFGPTCAQEIDLNERGTKLRTGLSCSPCYRRSCDKLPSCMDDISLPSVLEAIEQWVGAAEPTPTSAVGVGA